MKVYSRFSDRVTFTVLVICVIISFLVCLGIYAYEFQTTQEFWSESVQCVVEQNFQCILDIRTNQTINKDLFLTIIGANLSVIGVIFGFLAVTLYKSWHFGKKD